MGAIDNIRKIRIGKVLAVKKAGLNPFPETTKRSHSLAEANEQFDSLAAGEKEVVVAGRIKALRPRGGLAVVDIDDGTGCLRAIFDKAGLGPKGFEFFIDNFDTGDIIEVRGVLFKDGQEKRTIRAADFKMLAKSFRPLPEKCLADAEACYSKVNKDTKRELELSNVVGEIKNFLEKEGFLEADLYSKRFLVREFQKIFEIKKFPRDERADKKDDLEFTTLEFYWAYADYRQAMKLAEKMISSIANKLFKGEKIIYQGKEIDFKTPWQRIEYADLLEKYTGIKYEDINEAGLARKAKEARIDISKGANKSEIANEIYKKFCLPKLAYPTFVLHYPLESQFLAKQLESDSQKLADFHFVAKGVEIASAFSALNDPIEQGIRLKERRLFKLGPKNDRRPDKEFVEILEQGMPPAASLILNIDKLALLLPGLASSRKAILSPVVKPRRHSGLRRTKSAGRRNTTDKAKPSISSKKLKRKTGRTIKVK
ncbi:MAG: amino acid--tRNA ligase-related protein [Candidatus Paceibacterota bacterium]|jgi:lysyl-tRNA synthetase class 2